MFSNNRSSSPLSDEKINEISQKLLAEAESTFSDVLSPFEKPPKKRPLDPWVSLQKLLKQLQTHHPAIQVSVGASIGFSATFLLRKFTQTFALVLGCGAVVLVVWHNILQLENTRRKSKRASSLISQMADKSEQLAQKLADNIEKVMSEKRRKKETSLDRAFNFVHSNRFFMNGALGGAGVCFVIS